MSIFIYDTTLKIQACRAIGVLVRDNKRVLILAHNFKLRMEKKHTPVDLKLMSGLEERQDLKLMSGLEERQAKNTKVLESIVKTIILRVCGRQNIPLFGATEMIFTTQLI